MKYFYFIFIRIKLKRKHVRIDSNVSCLGTKFSNFNKIGKNSNVDRSNFGSFSYISENCFLVNVSIGSFCSIGPFVNIIYGTHPMDLISTCPVFYSTRKQCGTSFTEKSLVSEFKLISNSNYSVIIGNDVWIGYGVKIIEGITISDGAILLAGAYITKDVEPYSIVGGIPAKHIQYRFNEKQRKILLKHKWWYKDLDWIKNNASKFIDVDAFFKFISYE
jgi:acetyltransferase-like isoleucine patch superfamily enzyme